MNDDKLLCPVCGKTIFSEHCDYDICEYCGWENDDDYETGGMNDLSLTSFKARYQKYLELYPDYTWKKYGKPKITDKDEYELAHKYCYSNKTDIQSSKQCGCFFCVKIFTPGEITEWSGQTALCPYCGIDSVLPDSRVEFDRRFLEGMYKLWFE